MTKKTAGKSQAKPKPASNPSKAATKAPELARDAAAEPNPGKVSPGESRGPGRPPGAATTTEVVSVFPPACRKCQSTKREPYTNTTEHQHAGVHEGRPYTHVVWRSTRCGDCGQRRRDRFLENRPAELAGK